MRSSSLLSVLGLALGLALACSTDEGGPAANPEACQAIIDACHPKDDGSDPEINGCHAAAHDDETETCNARLEECVALCDAAPPVGGGYDTGDEDTGAGETAGDGSGGGSTTGGESADESTGGSEACVAHCECMATTCGEAKGYPFASEQACLDACAGYDDFTLSCYGSWCEAAAISPDPVHLCEHAWGSVGTSKC